MFRARYADVYKGDARWQGIAVAGGEDLCLAARLDLHRQSALFRGHDDDAGAAIRHHRRAPARHPGRFDHHRPHQPRRRDQARQPGRQIPDRASGRPRRLQLLRRPPRQSRGDDARHLRQHPDQEQDGPRHRGRHHHAHARPARRCRSTTRRCATRRRACRSSSSPARNMAPARRATGRPRAPICSASAPSSPRPTSASTAPTWSAWAWSRSSSSTRSPNSTAARPSPSSGVADLTPRQEIAVKVTRADGTVFSFPARVRIDTANELEYFQARRHPPLRAAAPGARERRA